jgi:hypothetical protein
MNRIEHCKFYDIWRWHTSLNNESKKVVWIIKYRIDTVLHEHRFTKKDDAYKFCMELDARHEELHIDRNDAYLEEAD